MNRLTLAHLTLMQPPLVMVEAAAAGGFESVGIRICPRRPGDSYFVNLLETPSDAEVVRQRAADLGISLSNVSAYQFYAEVEIEQLLPAVEVSAALGCRMIVANGFDTNLGRFQDRLGRYAEAAATHGITIALEPMPYSAVRNLAAGLDVIRKVGVPNLGLLLDILHLERSGGTSDDLLGLDPAHVAFAQLCDAAKATGHSNAELMHEARTARLPLGQGQLDLDDFMAALPEGVELEYEVAGLPGATPAEVALAARADLNAFLAR